MMLLPHILIAVVIIGTIIAHISDFRRCDAWAVRKWREYRRWVRDNRTGRFLPRDIYW